MSTISAETIAALGLDPDVEVRVEGRDVPPPDTVANMATIAEVVTLAMLLQGDVRDYPSSREINLASASADLGGIEVHAWDKDPDIIFVTARHGQVKAWGPHQTLSSRELVIDTRRQPAAARVTTFDYDLVIIKNPGEPVSWGRPVATAEVKVDLDALLRDVTCQPWLLEEAKAFAEAQSPINSATAAGLIGRLWSAPENQVQLPSFKTDTQEQNNSPRQRAIQWFMALDASSRTAVEKSAEVEAMALEEQLPALCNAVSAPGPAAVERAQAWLLQRDDLESVAWLLRQAGIGLQLSPMLAHLDLRAAVSVTAFAKSTSLSSIPRLAAVARQEPECWWGRLAGAG